MKNIKWKAGMKIKLTKKCRWVQHDVGVVLKIFKVEQGSTWYGDGMERIYANWGHYGGESGWATPKDILTYFRVVNYLPQGFKKYTKKEKEIK